MAASNVQPEYLMRIEGWTQPGPCPIAGQYLASFAPNAPDNGSIYSFTRKIDRAKRFGDVAAVLEEWRTIRRVDPIRPDGKPNRPLTAFTISPIRI